MDNVIIIAIDNDTPSRVSVANKFIITDITKANIDIDKCVSCGACKSACPHDAIYFNTCFDNLADYELLEFISQNIQAPFPPNLKQEEFERLVKVGIENDEMGAYITYERKYIVL